MATLRSIARNYGANVNVDPNLDNYRQGKTRFSAEISGSSVLWNGGQRNCIDILHKIQKEWERKLEIHVRGGSVNVYVKTRQRVIYPKHRPSKFDIESILLSQAEAKSDL